MTTPPRRLWSCSRRTPGGSRSHRRAFPRIPTAPDPLHQPIRSPGIPRRIALRSPSDRPSQTEISPKAPRERDQARRPPRSGGSSPPIRRVPLPDPRPDSLDPTVEPPEKAPPDRDQARFGAADRPLLAKKRISQSAEHVNRGRGQCHSSIKSKSLPCVSSRPKTATKPRASTTAPTMAAP